MTVSDRFRSSAFAQDTADVWLVLLTISHAELTEPIRVVNNTVDIVSRGERYIAFPFDITLPNSVEGSPPRARLVIDNVSREISQSIRTIQSGPLVNMEVIRADDPDAVEISWPFFWLQNVKWDAGKVSGDLALEDFTVEPYPAGIFSPADFPSAY